MEVGNDIKLKTMVKFILFFYLMSANYSCTSSYQNMRNDNDLLFEIVFQDYFSNDMIELKLNNCSIFSDSLTSSKILGVTKMRILAYKGTGLTYSIKIINKFVECNSNKDEINLEVVMNGHKDKFKVDLKKGRYIGFNKKNKNEVDIIQSMNPFVYD